MATYRISTPDGASYNVTAPDDATPDDVMAIVKQQHKPDQSYGMGLLRQAEQGLTLGLGDEANAFGRSVIGDETYDQALADERAKNEAFATENPKTAFAANIIGGLPLVAVPGLGGAKFISAAATPARAAGRAALVGAGYGGAAGFGSTEGGDGSLLEQAGNRAVGAAVGAPVGGALGGTLGYAGRKLGEAIGGARAASEEVTGTGGAYNVVAKSLGQDSVNPSDLRSGILPLPTRTVSNDMTTEIVRLGEQGLTQADIAARVGVSTNTVGRVQRAFSARNQTPLTIVDRAKMQGPGEGTNTEWRMRAAAATPGEARTQAARTLTERQVGQGQRLVDAIQKYIGDGTDDSIAALQNSLRAQERAVYDAAKGVERPFDLLQVLKDWQGLARGDSGPIATKLREATDLFFNQTDVPNDLRTSFIKAYYPIKGLDRFQQAKQALDHMIETSFHDGRPTRLTSVLTRFKSDVMKPVRDSNPVWAEANDTFAGAGAKALKAGENLALRLNTRSRSALDYFRQLEARARDANPARAASGKAQIELFRQSMSRNLQERLANRQQTHDLTSELRLPGARQILQRVLPKKQAAELLRLVDEEAATTSSFRALSGSQTTPLKEAIEDLNAPAYLTSALQYMNPKAIMSELLRYGAGKLYAPRNAQVMNLLTETDPVRQLQILDDIARHSAARKTGAVNATRYVTPIANSLISASQRWP